MAIRLSALLTGSALFPRNITILHLVLISVSLNKPQGLVQLEGVFKFKKNSMTSSGLDPATFHLVAYCLNLLGLTKVNRHYKAIFYSVRVST
jgi:hypothetical protein